MGHGDLLLRVLEVKIQCILKSLRPRSRRHVKTLGWKLMRAARRMAESTRLRAEWCWWYITRQSMEPTIHISSSNIFFNIKPSITVQCVSVFAILSMICECLFLNLPMYLNIWSNHCIKWKMCDRHIAFQKMKIIFVISHFHRMSYSKQYWNAISNLFLPCSQIKVNKTGILSTSVEPRESDYWNLNKQIENL